MFRADVGYPRLPHFSLLGAGSALLLVSISLNIVAPLPFYVTNHVALR